MKVLGSVTFKIIKDHTRYRIDGGCTKNNGFGWANREESYGTKEEAIKAIIETVKNMYIENNDLYKDSK